MSVARSLPFEMPGFRVSSLALFLWPLFLSFVGLFRFSVLGELWECEYKDYRYPGWTAALGCVGRCGSSGIIDPTLNIKVNLTM